MGPTLRAEDARAEGPVSATVRTSLSPECDGIFWQCGVLAVLQAAFMCHFCACMCVRGTFTSTPACLLTDILAGQEQ